MRVEWSQTDSCRYLGVGFPWANYMGKNLKPLEKIAAIQCHIKLERGTASKIPMFFALIDYAGRQATSKINLLDVEGQTFDDQWRKSTYSIVRVSCGLEGVNLENIKELRIEFQREGCVHLDGIRIVPFEHQGEKLSPRSQDVCGALPLDLGRSKLWWGIQENAPSSSIFGRNRRGVLLGVEARQGGANKEWNAFGVALNGWEMLDMSRCIPTRPDVSLGGGMGASWHVHLVGQRQAAAHQSTLTPQHCLQLDEGIWSCALPIKSMPRHDEFDWTGTREVRVTLPDDTDVSLHNLAWEVYRGHPGKVERWLQRRQP